MTLIIDTGPTQERTAIGYVPDWFRDIHSDRAEDARVVQSYAYHLISEMSRPAKQDTVRKHVLAQWGFLRLLADEEPAVFDEFWTAYAERVLS